MRKRSVGVGAAARLQRALSTKALPNSSPNSAVSNSHSPLTTSASAAPGYGGAGNNQHISSPQIQHQQNVSNSSSPGVQDQQALILRQFVMEAAVQFTTVGVASCYVDVFVLPKKLN